MPSFALNADAVNAIASELPSDAILVVDKQQDNIPAPVTQVDAEVDAVEEVPEVTPEPEPVAQEPTPEPLPQHILTDEQWATWNAYQSLDQRLRQDPQFAERFRSAFAPQGAAPPAPPAEPSYQEPLDPQYVQLQQQLAQQAEALRALQSLMDRQQETENKAVMNRAKEAFQTSHNLSATQMAKVYDEAQKYAGALQSFYDQGVDQQTALTKVFSAAYWNLPEFQEAELAKRTQTAQQDATRKAKASSLTSNSGSAPRTAPTGPMTEQQRREAMTRDLAEAFGQSQE